MTKLTYENIQESGWKRSGESIIGDRYYCDGIKLLAYPGGDVYEEYEDGYDRVLVEDLVIEDLETLKRYMNDKGVGNATKTQ